MKSNQFRRSSGEHGSVLVGVVVFGFLLGIGCISLLSFSSARIKASHHRWNTAEAFYHAENVLNWGAQMIGDGAGSPEGTYSVSNGKLALSYLGTLTSSNTAFQNAWLTVSKHPSGLANAYLVTASAKVENRVRTVQAMVQKNPASEVFDYEYFLNNWGWWWGSSITGNGGNRANGDFDFRGNPTVNGAIIANGDIESNGIKIDRLGGSVPINGLAGVDPIAYLHDGAPKLEMPNLKNFDYYQKLATAKAGSLSAGSNVVINAVHDKLQGTIYNSVRVSAKLELVKSRALELTRYNDTLSEAG